MLHWLKKPWQACAFANLLYIFKIDKLELFNIAMFSISLLSMGKLERFVCFKHEIDDFTSFLNWNNFKNNQLVMYIREYTWNILAAYEYIKCHHCIFQLV